MRERKCVFSDDELAASATKIIYKKAIIFLLAFCSILLSIFSISSALL